MVEVWNTKTERMIFVKPLRLVANELGLDVTTVRKFAVKYDIPMSKYRGPETNNQVSCAFTDEDFARFVEMRQQLGYGENEPNSNGIAIKESGVFYFIHLIPEFDRRRVKLGFTSDVRGRFQSHRCSAPTMEIAETWACKREWESAAIAAITNIDGVKQIGAEVFEFPDVDVALERANRFFQLFEQDISALPEDE